MNPRELRQIGPYEVKCFIDEGAFAWVYEVADPKFAGRRLALKMLKPEAAAGEEFHRFERESQLLGGMDHPSIVTIFDFGKDPTTEWFYYTMTFVDGPTLKKRLLEGPIPVTEALNLFVDLLDGLHHLHEQSIVHRDIKPANVLIGRDGRARLSDLGIARVETERSQTRTGVAVGTALYMSPEQARGRPVDSRSDLFSAGLTLYEALTCNTVYDHVEDIDSTSGMDVLIYIGRLDQQKHAEFEVHFPKQPEIPAPVKRVIRKACHLRAEQRYQSAAEMRDALSESLRAPALPEAAGGIHWRWVAAPAAALVTVAAALAFYFGVHLPGLRADEARALIEMAASLEERTLALVESARDLEPGPSVEVLEEIESRSKRASDYLLDGSEDLEAGAYSAALANLNRALAHFEGACQSLSAGFLAERADTDAARVADRVERIRRAEPAEVAAESWQQLAALLPGTAAPETAQQGCDGAASQLSRVAVGAEASAAAASLEQELAEAWPRLAQEALQHTLAARKLAEAEAVEATEYKLAVREGKTFQLRGDQTAASRDFIAARDHYRSAEESFRTALAIAPAARARAGTRALAEEITRGGTLLGGVVRLLSRADDHFAAKRWKEATGLYEEAFDQLRSKRDENEQRAGSLEAQTAAIVLRESASAEGAERSAVAEFRRAEQTRIEAERSLDEKRYPEAERGFATARDQYSEARELAIRALRDAGLAQAEVQEISAALLGSGGCTDLGATRARQACSRAEAERAGGSAALAELDAPAAVQRFAAARDGYSTAATAQRQWDAARPRPPQLVKRTPQRARVELTKNERRSFAVEARDPNGDALSYSWTFDGELQPETGSSFERKLQKSGVLTVRVEDGAGGQLSEQWEVALRNRMPSLVITPKGLKFSLAVGESLDFNARASDPDGDPVSQRAPEPRWYGASRSPGPAPAPPRLRPRSPRRAGPSQPLPSRESSRP
jgi:serine/threonine-protein kinase